MLWERDTHYLLLGPWNEIHSYIPKLFLCSFQMGLVCWYDRSLKHLGHLLGLRLLNSPLWTISHTFLLFLIIFTECQILCVKKKKKTCKTEINKKCTPKEWQDLPSARHLCQGHGPSNLIDLDRGLVTTLVNRFGSWRFQGFWGSCQDFVIAKACDLSTDEILQISFLLQSWAARFSVAWQGSYLCSPGFLGSQELCLCSATCSWSLESRCRRSMKPGGLRRISLSSPALSPQPSPSLLRPLSGGPGDGDGVVVGTERPAARLLGIQTCHNSPHAAPASLLKVRLISP